MSRPSGRARPTAGRRDPSPPGRRRVGGHRVGRPSGGRHQTRPPGWKWLFLGPGALTVGVALALVLAWRVDSNAQTSGEQQAAGLEGQLGSAPSAGVPLPSPLKAYSITYRITEPNTPTQIEKKLIQRPFYGSDLTYSSRGQVSSGAVTGPSGAYIFESSPQPHWGLLETGTFRATGDDQAAPALALAVQHGLARVIGSAQVLGRTCTVVRTNGPVGDTVAAPTASDYTDIYLDDATGQVLNEVWVLNGELVRQRLATAFDPHPRIGAGAFTVTSSGPVVPAGTSGSTVVVNLKASDIAHLPVWAVPPPRFHLDGVQAQVTDQSEPGAATVAPATTVVAHYVDGPNLMDINQGTVNPPPSGSLRIALPGHRYGSLTIDLVASYIDLSIDGQPVRLEGPNLHLLLELAARLRLQPQAASPGG
ncbi:MAG TPA: hypothetical protein VNF50_13220 [Acidimicrobiales bacterium]|nr:hypothetical protein [Acidimicrobiales bacterium]